jgi:hypothetical protein
MLPLHLQFYMCCAKNGPAPSSISLNISKTHSRYNFICAVPKKAPLQVQFYMSSAQTCPALITVDMCSAIIGPAPIPILYIQCQTWSRSKHSFICLCAVPKTVPLRTQFYMRSAKNGPVSNLILYLQCQKRSRLKAEAFSKYLPIIEVRIYLFFLTAPHREN